MVREAIPKEGILERFGRGFSQDFRSREQTIAGQRIQTDQARLANALERIKFIALTTKDNEVANTQLNQMFLDDPDFPEFAGGHKDFGTILDKFRLGPQLPKGFEPSGVTIGPEGKISQRFAPKAKTKQFDILTLNDRLFQITHTKDAKGKIVEIEPNPSDLRALQIAAEQSGFELRKSPKTFAKVGKLGGVIQPTFVYKLIPKKKPAKTIKKTQSKQIDVTKLTDKQLDAIIETK